MFAKILLHLLVVMIFPSLGDRLFGWVCPRVAVMEVDHQVHTKSFGTLGHSQQLVLIVHAATWVHPHSHADGLHLVVLLQQFQALAFFTITVVKFHAMFFLPREKSHIGSFHKITLSKSTLRNECHNHRYK